MTVVLLLLTLPAVSEAQTTEAPTDCPTIVQTAITLTNQRCESTADNEVCYGHLVLDAQPRAGLDPFAFAEPGDIVDVIDVQSLRLSALDTDSGQWGVVLMQLDAALVESPASNDQVQILLFGDAELNDATTFLPGKIRRASNIRSRPTTSSQLITTVQSDDEITANGRTSDASWIRVNLAEGTGWIRADLIDLNGNIDSLTVISGDVSADDLVAFGPMQAFYFRSGINDAPCAEAPNSGLLIQTPEGVASVSIWMDEVVVQLDATAFIQAAPNGELTVTVLDGSAQVTAVDETRTAVAGTSIAVALNPELMAEAVPSDPVPFDPVAVQSLPIGLLDDPITIPDPFNQPANRPIAGSWQFGWDVASLTCPDGTTVPFESTGIPGPVEVTAESVIWNLTTYNQSTPSVYRSSYVDGSGNLHQDTLQIIAPDRIIGEKILDLNNPVCTLNVGFRLQLVHPTDE